MGLETINFFFRSEEEIESKMVFNQEIEHCGKKKYVYKNDNNFWIDIEFQGLYSLSIRITLCNPKDSVLNALNRLLSFLFNFKGAILIDLSTKQIYNNYNEDVKKELEESYLNRKRVFEDIYGDYTAAIDSDEFYRRFSD